jgi:hypothetical protein
VRVIILILRWTGRRIVPLALATLADASATGAQTAGDSSGAIVGIVADPAGGVIAGVRVCVSSPALMAERCAESDGGGAYRLLALAPGEYAVAITFDGLEVWTHEGVRVGLGETASLPVTIELAPHRADVIVEGTPRALDPFATMRGARFTAEQLAFLPGARSMGAIIVTAPAVLMTRHDVGGNTALAPGPWSAHGVAGYSRPTLDGISVANINPFGLTLDYGSFDHVWLGLGAYGPEWPSPGIHLQAVTRSGGNRYRGGVYAAMEPESWQARNVDADQMARGAAESPRLPATSANQLAGYHDVNADAGGFIRKDRVWWYGSVRDQEAAQFRVTFPAAPVETRARSATAKMTARIGSGGRIVLFGYGGLVEQPIRLDGFLLSGERAINESIASTTGQVSKGAVWKSEWNGNVRGRVFIEGRVGQFLASRAERPNRTDAASARLEDTASGIVAGPNRDWRAALSRDQVYASLSHLSGGSRGRHLMKAGGEIVRDVWAEQWIGGYPGDVLHLVQNGVPREVFLLQTPSRSETGQWWFSGYASDSWQVTPRLTLNAGLRFDRFRLFLPDQALPAGRFSPESRSFAAVPNLIDWNVVAPRLGMSYAVDGGGATIVKGTYGRYWLPPSPELGFNANPNARVWLARYGWSDVNGSGVWEAGEERALLERRGGTAADALDPGLRLPYMREATLHVQHEAAAQVVLTTGVVWRGERQQGLRQPATWPFEAFTVPAPRRDPGADGVAGTRDDGAEVLLYDLPPGVNASAGTIIGNVARSDSDFVTWELAAERPFRGRWSLSVSIARTWNRHHAAAYLNQPLRNNEYPLTPNDLVNTDREGRYVFSAWTAKALITVEAPWHVRLTPLVRYQSGQPFGRTFLTQLPNYGSVRVLAEPLGTRRQDRVLLIDVRAEKAFRIAEGRRAAAFVEVFNALNANPEQNVNWSSGQAFLRPLNIVSPRIVRVGLTLGW